MRQEQRKSTRRFVRHGARIIGTDGSALGPCVMLDLSSTGARLKTDASEVLPDEFILLLSHDGRLRRQCSVAWRSAKAIGVRFHHGRQINRK
jgi:PilZ domain-containing protein